MALPRLLLKSAATIFVSVTDPIAGIIGTAHDGRPSKRSSRSIGRVNLRVEWPAALTRNEPARRSARRHLLAVSRHSPKRIAPSLSRLIFGIVILGCSARPEAR